MLAAAGWPISELVPHGSDSVLQSTVSAARPKSAAVPSRRGPAVPSRRGPVAARPT